MGAAIRRPAPAPSQISSLLSAEPLLLSAIQQLSDSPSAFLSCCSLFPGPFDLDQEHVRSTLEALLVLDPRLKRWLARLVPKRVDERIFFSNYFGHVLAVIEGKADQHQYSRTNQQPTQIALIGTGAAATAMATVCSSSCYSIHSVYSRTPSRAADFARLHSVAAYFSSVDALAARPPPPAIAFIATPTGQHYTHFIQLSAMDSCFLVARPLARNAEETGLLINKARERGRPLLANMTRRWSPAMVKLKKDINALGRLSSFSYQLVRAGGCAAGGWRVDCAQSGGGPLMEYGSDVIDLIEYLIGPITMAEGHAASVGAFDETGAMENIVNATLKCRRFTGPEGSQYYNIEDDAQTETEAETETEPAFPIFGSALFDFSGAGPGWLVDELSVHGVGGTIRAQLIGDDGERQTAATAMAHAERLLSQARHEPHLLDPYHRSYLRTAARIDDILSGFYRQRVGLYWKKPHTWNNHNGEKTNKITNTINKHKTTNTQTQLLAQTNTADVEPINTHK